MSKKILIIDDTFDIRNLLVQILGELKDQDVELLSAVSGEKGLQVALTERPDLIFLDVKMPDINGYEVCQRIKAVNGGVYVILLTGYIPDSKRGAEVGADEHIRKPFRPDHILERATTILGLNF